MDIKWTWRPMFVLGNSADTMELIGGDNDLVKSTVFSNGSVVWFQTMITTTICDVDISAFPYDEQECDVYLAFMGNDGGGNFAFNLTYTEVMTGFYLTNAEWVYIGSSVMTMNSMACCPTTNIPFYVVSMKWQRLHAFYLNTLLMPTILLSIMLVWPFYLPSEDGGRIGFALTIFLSYTVVLSMTSSFLPTTSRQVPMLATYLLVVLFLCTMAVCNVTLHVKFYFLKSDPPRFMKGFYRVLNPIIFMHCCKKKKSNKVEAKVVTVEAVEKPPLQGKSQGGPDEHPVDEDSDDDELTWAVITVLLDRICFYLYSLAIIILNLVLMIYLGTS